MQYAIRYTTCYTQYAIRYTLHAIQAAIRYPLYAIRYFIMQNKPNFRKSQMNVSSYITTEYEAMDTWSSGENKPNQSQNKPNTNPIPLWPKWTQAQLYKRIMKMNAPSASVKTNPIKPNTNPIQTQSPYGKNDPKLPSIKGL